MGKEAASPDEKKILPKKEGIGDKKLGEKENRSEDKRKTSAEIKEEKKKQFEGKKLKLEASKKVLADRIQADSEIDKGFAGEPGEKSNESNPDIKKAKDQSDVIEKETLTELKEKHDADIQDAVEHVENMDPQTRKVIHAGSLEKSVKVENLPKETKEEALRGLKGEDGKDIDATKPLTPSQVEIVQKYQTARYLEAIKQIKEEDKNDPEEIKEHLKELEKKNPGIKDFVDGKKITLFSEDSFFEEAKKDPSLLRDVIESIKKDGMIATGIIPNSTFGKTLVAVIKENTDEYLGIKKPQEGLVDVENFKGLQDILGGSYEDLVYSKNFLLGDKHVLKEAQKTIFDGFQSEVTQLEPLDPLKASPQEMQAYRKSLEQAFHGATGIEGTKVERAISGISRDKLSPIIRFFLDLFAPIGAAMGGKVGERCKQYLAQSRSQGAQSKYGEGISQPIEGKGIENASASAIHEAAKKYVGTTESKDGDLIREMHKSGGHNAGPGTAWCMSFVQHVLRHDMGFNSSQIGPPTAWAADGHSIGRHTETPKPGDIVLIHSSLANSGKHIGFVNNNPKTDGYVEILGGNQSNSVNVTRYSLDKVAEFRTLENAPNPIAQNNLDGAGHESGQNSLPENKGTVEKTISYDESLRIMSDPNTPKYDKDGKLIVYRVDISNYPRDTPTQEKYNKNIGRGDKDKHFIAVHGTASDYGVNGGLTEEKLDQSGFHEMINSGLYPYFISKKGIVFSTTENDSNHPACVNDKANEIIGYERFNNKGLAIEMSLRTDHNGSVEKPNADQMKSGHDLILALRGKYNIGAGNVITSKDPVRDPITGEFRGEHADDFDDSVRASMGIARYDDTAKRFREKKFFTDALASNNNSVNSAEIDGYIGLIKNNESGNRPGNEGYADWNEGEAFPSMGFAHFIWGTNTNNGNSFHEMMQHITTRKKIEVPPNLQFLLSENPPWSGKNRSDGFPKMRADPRYGEMTDFLARTDVKRAGYDYIQNYRLASLSKNLTGNTLEKFNMLARGPKGVYILTDYVNFKGPGDPGSPTSWGLVNVLENMGMPANPQDAARRFSESAKNILQTRRSSSYVKNGNGWDKRMDTYL